MTVHDETKDTLVITVIFLIFFHRKRRHVSKLLLVLTDVGFSFACVFSFRFDLYEAKLCNTEAVNIFYVQKKLTHKL